MARKLKDLHIFKTAADKMLVRTDYKMSRWRFILMIKNEKIIMLHQLTSTLKKF